MDMQRCENCRSWWPGNPYGNPYGQCRAQPPVRGDRSHSTSFPEIGADEWCAGWKGRAVMSRDVQNAVAPRDMAPPE